MRVFTTHNVHGPTPYIAPAIHRLRPRQTRCKRTLLRMTRGTPESTKPARNVPPTCRMSLPSYNSSGRLIGRVYVLSKLHRRALGERGSSSREAMLLSLTRFAGMVVREAVGVSPLPNPASRFSQVAKKELTCLLDGKPKMSSSSLGPAPDTSLASIRPVDLQRTRQLPAFPEAVSSACCVNACGFKSEKGPCALKAAAGCETTESRLMGTQQQKNRPATSKPLQQHTRRTAGLLRVNGSRSIPRSEGCGAVWGTADQRSVRCESH